MISATIKRRMPGRYGLSKNRLPNLRSNTGREATTSFGAGLGGLFTCAGLGAAALFFLFAMSLIKVKKILKLQSIKLSGLQLYYGYIDKTEKNLTFQKLI